MKTTKCIQLGNNEIRYQAVQRAATLESDNNGNLIILPILSLDAHAYHLLAERAELIERVLND
jgi:hypothetical protein